MLLSQPERDIMRDAEQPAQRASIGDRTDFGHIIDDFFTGVDFSTGNYLELGPGQWDFCDIIKARGGVFTGIDRCDAVCNLGVYRGHNVVQMELRDIAKLNIRYDGIFCRGSFNAFWFYMDDYRHVAFIDSIAGLMKPKAWAWLYPSNLKNSLPITENDAKQVIAVQQQTFLSHGFDMIKLTPELIDRYRTNHDMTNTVFTKNLRMCDA